MPRILQESERVTDRDFTLLARLRRQDLAERVGERVVDVRIAAGRQQVVGAEDVEYLDDEVRLAPAAERDRLARAEIDAVEAVARELRRRERAERVLRAPGVH